MHTTSRLSVSFCSRIFEYFSQAKVPENMAPKKSKEKKPKAKRSVTQPAKSIIERTVFSHPMLKRVPKEVRELQCIFVTVCCVEYSFTRFGSPGMKSHTMRHLRK